MCRWVDFKLCKTELGKNILCGISAGDYPVDIPYFFFRVVFVGYSGWYEYGGIRWYWGSFALKDERAAAFGAVKYLVIVVALWSYKVILTVLLTHILQIEGQGLFVSQDRIIGKEQKYQLHIHIVIN